MQMKVTGDWKEVVGVVTKIRGNHPVTPTKIAVTVLPDGEEKEVTFDYRHVIEVLPA